MAIRRFDERDFRTGLSRKGGMDPLQADMIAGGLGDLASEIREGYEAVKGAVHRVDEKLSKVAAAVLGPDDPRQHLVLGFQPAEGQVAGLCIACTWSTVSRTPDEIPAFQEKHQAEVAAR